MKTWLFSEDKLEEEVAAWVKAQIATGHPKAVANAKFVGEAIKDMLHTSKKLFTTKSAHKTTAEYNQPVKTVYEGGTETRVSQSLNPEPSRNKNTTKELNLSVSQMISEWESME